MGRRGLPPLAISRGGRRGREGGGGPGLRAGLQIGRGLGGAREGDLPGVGSGSRRQGLAGDAGLVARALGPGEGLRLRLRGRRRGPRPGAAAARLRQRAGRGRHRGGWRGTAAGERRRLGNGMS